VSPELAGRIDLLLDTGPAPGGAPSTIVDTREGSLRLVRAGAVAWDRVLRSIK
jgi:tRNA A37 threonylcarbamoyladenosine synthetase subunit TsaC/SUA5/YrdC